MRRRECVTRWPPPLSLLLASPLLVLSACHDSAAPADQSQPDPGSCATNAGPGGDGQEVPPNVLTEHNDVGRTGAMLVERTLTTCNVHTLTMQGEYQVDGELYAQPLYMTGVSTNAGTLNLLIVATMADSVFAFDADQPGSKPIWQLGHMQELGTPALSARNVGGNNGILATPVIDADNGTLFVMSRDCDPKYAPSAPHCEQRLFAIELGTGKILRSVSVAGGVPSTAGGAQTVFDPNLHWSRSALLLQHGQLFVSFGSGPNGNAHEEDFEFHGWLFGYQAQDFSVAPSVYCSTPGFGGGAIWQSGNGPAGRRRCRVFRDRQRHSPAHSGYSWGLSRATTGRRRQRGARAAVRARYLHALLG